MKKFFYLFLIIAIVYSPVVFAHEKYDDGWHIVPENTEDNKGKTWSQQTKEWAYYENGEEAIRYTKLVGSHRGWGTAPENSLASFRITRENGYYAFETDVRFTKDNVPVLIHDEKINNIARDNNLNSMQNDIYVKDLTYNQLYANYIFNIERLNHSGSPTPLTGYETNRVTTFEEMLEYVKANRMYVSIELKEGTKEQIRSLVDMTHDQGVHNYVRWISYYTDLLYYVVDYDNDENISVTKNDTCDPNHNLYCGEETEHYLEKLKTDKNLIWITNNPDRMPSIACAVNMPYNQNGYSPRDGLINTIPKGEVTVDEKSQNLLIGSNVSIPYTYTGDGVVKCKSNNTSKVTCSVDTENKFIDITSVGNEATTAKVMVYSSQGISTSASDDTTIQVKVGSEKDRALDELNGITVKGYTLNFNKNTYTYKLKIKDEKELNIGVNLDTDEFTYKVEGNKDLKDGSKVLVKILNDSNEVLLTYTIEIEKVKDNPETLIDIPNTFMGVPTINIILSMLAITIGITIFGYHYVTEK